MRKLGLLVVLVLPLAACGGGGGGSSQSKALTLTPLAYVKTSAHKTAQAPSEHLDLQGSASVGSTAVQLNGQGDFDNAKKLGAMHADFSAGGLSGTIDEIVNGTTVYLKSPLFAAALPAGKEWLKLDLQKVGRSKGLDFSALTSQSPEQALAQLEGAGKVTKLGDETIDGAPTTHYRVRVDVDKVPQGAKIEALTGAKYAPIDIWIGKDDGYVHRMHLAYALAAGGSKQTIAMTMSFSDFGKSVDVTVPSDGQSLDTTGSLLSGVGS